MSEYKCLVVNQKIVQTWGACSPDCPSGSLYIPDELLVNIDAYNITGDDGTTITGWELDMNYIREWFPFLEENNLVRINIPNYLCIDDPVFYELTQRMKAINPPTTNSEDKATRSVHLGFVFNNVAVAGKPWVISNANYNDFQEILDHELYGTSIQIYWYDPVAEHIFFVRKDGSDATVL
jgi:hypothetical protein